jgi:hypothetical protein
MEADATHGSGIVVARDVVLVLTVLAVNVNIVTGPWSIRTGKVPLVAKLVQKAPIPTMDAALRETADAYIILV